MVETENLRELAHRAGNGVDVSLLWNEEKNSLTVLVIDVQLGTSFEIPAANDNALDVFYHPFAYAGAAP